MQKPLLKNLLKSFDFIERIDCLEPSKKMFNICKKNKYSLVWTPVYRPLSTVWTVHFDAFKTNGYGGPFTLIL